MVPHNDCRRGTAIRCDPHLGYSPPNHGGDTPFERLSRTARSWHLLQTSQERTAPTGSHLRTFPQRSVRTQTDFSPSLPGTFPQTAGSPKQFDRARGALASATDLMWSYTGRTNGAPGGRQGVGSRLLTPRVSRQGRSPSCIHFFEGRLLARHEAGCSVSACQRTVAGANCGSKFGRY